MNAWTHDRVIERIQTWATETGQPPKQTDWNPARARMMAEKATAKARAWLNRATMFDGDEWPSDWTVRNLFGSFSAALHAAGFEPRPVGTTPRELTARQVSALRRHAQWRPTGPAVLAASLRAINEARQADDKLALRGALYDLAATAMAWVDELERSEDREAVPA